jgi:PAS domain S-box-containing protein
MAAPDASIDRLVALGAAIDAAPMCVFVADAEMRYVAVNAYACELLGYAEEELLRMRVSDIAAYDEAPQEYDDRVRLPQRNEPDPVQGRRGDCAAVCGR